MGIGQLPGGTVRPCEHTQAAIAVAVRKFVTWADLLAWVAPMPGGLALPIVVAADAWRCDPQGLHTEIGLLVTQFRAAIAAMRRRDRQLYLGAPPGQRLSCLVAADGQPLTPKRDIFHDVARFRGTPETGIAAVCRKLQLWPAPEALRAYALVQAKRRKSSKYQQYEDLLWLQLPWLGRGLWPKETTEWTWTWDWRYDPVTQRDTARFVTGRSRPAPRPPAFL